MESKYAVVVSVSTDYNRGDQALLWQTQDIIKETLGISKVYILENENEELIQSKSRGLIQISPVLYHPSHKFKKKSEKNVNYSLSLKLKWGISGMVDFVKQDLLLHKWTRKVGEKALNENQYDTYRLIKNAEAVFVKGGGFIHAYGKITDLYYIYYSLYHIRLAQALNRKVYILPNSYGPFEGFGIAKVVSKTLSACTLLTVRESISQKMLSNIGVKNSVLTPDMAFYLHRLESEQAKEIVKYYKLNKNGKNVAITVRPYRFPEAENPQQACHDYKKQIGLFVEWLRQNDYRPIFVEHVFSENDHENDRKCIDEINDELPNPIEVISNRCLNCEELKFIYSNFDYVIGTRFHSVIFSLSENVPGLAISYSGNKAIGIMKDLGLDNYVLPAKELKFEDMKERFLQIIENLDDYKEKVRKYIDFANNKHNELREMIKEKSCG